MSNKAAEHHKQSAKHHTNVPRHHGEAAKHYESGQHEKAAHHAPKPPTDEAMKAMALSEWEGEGGAPSDERKPKRPR